MSQKILLHKTAQPKAMYLLFSVQMWESFSYYGMRAILALYMITVLKFDDAKAFGISAMYIALAECLGIFGGRLADKVFGARNAIYFGGTLIALGHAILAIPIDGLTLYFSLAFISVGTGLFRSNCLSLLGEFYGENDPRRDAGFTLFYVGINLGAFLATFFCAYIAQTFGWHYGFSLAAFGMVLGLTGLFRFSYLLEEKGFQPSSISKKRVTISMLSVTAVIPIFAVLLFYHEVGTILLLAAIFLMFFSTYRATKFLPTKQKKDIGLVILSILLLAIFYAFEEQIGSSIVVFAERYAKTDFFGFEMPASALSMFNPLTILLMGPLVAMTLSTYELRQGRNVSVFTKISLAFTIQGIAFLLLYLGILESKITSYLVAFNVGMIAFSELFIGPAVYAFCSENSPKHLKGMLMGTVMLGYSLSGILSGFMSKFMAISDENSHLAKDVYAQGFFSIMVVCFAAAVVIYILKVFFSRRKYA